VTVEVSPSKADLARRNFERSGFAGWIHQEVREAGEFLRRQAPSSFDLVFLDSDRDQYVAWWAWIQQVLAPAGLLVADNAVSHAEEMAEFMAAVRDTVGWRSLVVPVGKGEFVAVKQAAATDHGR
jgi:predicted O-methyltransferase YrrM